MKPLSILLVSDFFHPSVGGVETHIYNLAQSLIERGHKVTVLTRMYGKRSGVRYLRGGLKVYHVPRMPIYKGTSLPTIHGTMRLFRVVALREQVDLVHCHQAFSTLAMECLWHAQSMKINTVFTDHSLHGFADMSSILMNKLLKLSCVNVGALICVSNVSKENTVLRASISPDKVFVIPNAVHTAIFSPKGKLAALLAPPRGRQKTVVVVSRLVYRRGVDLLAQIIGKVCTRDPTVRFLIVGDGPKKRLLDHVVEKEQIGGQVELLGSLPHEEIIKILEQGDIFLNLSLTEAFGMAMLEAASVGLLIVSTAVGGIPEILPPVHASAEPGSGMILCKPEAQSILSAVAEAFAFLPRTRAQVLHQHNLVKRAYNWSDVARRTEKVYEYCQGATGEGQGQGQRLFHRLVQFLKVGLVLGPICCCCAVIDVLYLRYLEFVQPHVERAVPYPPHHGGPACPPKPHSRTHVISH